MPEFLTPPSDSQSGISEETVDPTPVANAEPEVPTEPEATAPEQSPDGTEPAADRDREREPVVVAAPEDPPVRTQGEAPRLADDAPEVSDDQAALRRSTHAEPEARPVSPRAPPSGSTPATEPERDPTSPSRRVTGAEDQEESRLSTAIPEQTRSANTPSVGSRPASSRYTIQLANLTRATDLASFLDRHAIPHGEVRTVAADYDGATRYLVLWGTFDSWADARDALPSLPGNGRLDGAWIRGVEGIDVLREVAVSARQRERPEPVTQATPATAADSRRPAATAYSDPILSGDLDTLLEADPDWYTVQLASMREAESVQRYMALHELSDLPVTRARIWRDGGDWYLILYGAWPSLAEARNAVRALPGSVQAEGPWTRRLGPIQDAVRR